MKVGDGLVYCSLDWLLKQRAQAKRLQYGRKNVHSRQTGNQLSIYKGRGMAFAESRPYQAGDDVRLLDWRVTARTGKAYTKLFIEEKERPVLLWIDLRPPMFFATRGCYKSVLAATLASLLLWKNWLDGDCVGGVIIDTKGEIHTFKPTRCLSAISRMLQVLAIVTQAKRIKNERVQNIPFIEALVGLNSMVRQGGQLILISDFRGLSPLVEQRLRLFQHRISLALVAISDPFEQQLPETRRLALCDNGCFLTLNASDKIALQPYYATVQQREQQLTQLAQQLRIPLMQISTADKPTEQLLTLMRGFQ
ncbi:MAG TPA: DUF58 domain-containing protein [Thiothrix sp.]|nr:DUF58 domain-containing protein [Thiothrix sp.]